MRVFGLFLLLPRRVGLIVEDYALAGIEGNTTHARDRAGISGKVRSLLEQRLTYEEIHPDSRMDFPGSGVVSGG